MANEPKQAKCPECGERTLCVEYIAEKFASYTLLENGIDGECVDESGGDDSSVSSVFCTSCEWQEFDDAEEFINKMSKDSSNA